nr:hypothetical protein [uncultured Flavobacterium sp.]
MKTKIRFSDITGMLERDEMKEIIGGCGNSYGSAAFSPNPLGGGGGGGLSGFGGGTAIGSTFGGQPYAGYSNPVTNSYYASSSSGSSGNTSGSTWQSTANGYTTTNATEISRILEFLNGQSNGQSIANFNPNISQIYSFVAGEMQFAAAGTVTLPNGTVWGGELNNVTVYHTTDPRSPNYNPYGQWDASTVAGVLDGIGGSISNTGIILTSYGATAPVGVVLIEIGGGISLIGKGIEFVLDMVNKTPEDFDYGKWAVQIGLEANSAVFGSFTTSNGEKVYFELSQKGIEYIYDMNKNDPN